MSPDRSYLTASWRWLTHYWLITGQSWLRRFKGCWRLSELSLRSSNHVHFLLTVFALWNQLQPCATFPKEAVSPHLYTDPSSLQWLLCTFSAQPFYLICKGDRAANPSLTYCVSARLFQCSKELLLQRSLLGSTWSALIWLVTGVLNCTSEELDRSQGSWTVAS